MSNYPSNTSSCYRIWERWEMPLYEELVNIGTGRIAAIKRNILMVDFAGRVLPIYEMSQPKSHNGSVRKILHGMSKLVDPTIKTESDQYYSEAESFINGMVNIYIQRAQAVIDHCRSASRSEKIYREAKEDWNKNPTYVESTVGVGESHVDIYPEYYVRDAWGRSDHYHPSHTVYMPANNGEKAAAMCQRDAALAECAKRQSAIKFWYGRAQEEFKEINKYEAAEEASIAILHAVGREDFVDGFFDDGGRGIWQNNGWCDMDRELRDHLYRRKYDELDERSLRRTMLVAMYACHAVETLAGGEYEKAERQWQKQRTVEIMSCSVDQYQADSMVVRPLQRSIDAERKYAALKAEAERIEDIEHDKRIDENRRILAWGKEEFFAASHEEQVKYYHLLCVREPDDSVACRMHELMSGGSSYESAKQLMEMEKRILSQIRQEEHDAKRIRSRGIAMVPITQSDRDRWRRQRGPGIEPD